ncbi:hypothetical protein [Robiginitalea aurantiaca]|uniref:DUF1761 domain-containing protein n=1 Tax=Robiginitalea aurantiaca TaxID=3056915 RepID=A0ABT7WES6_9FLAO|nr:hypothetical protein [Robiginitalea aurantiaca]MDM9631422.1 hypothetical protein [Robiginitalea aurantiaca]
MFTKQNLLATAAAAVVMFLLGYLLWGIALDSIMKSHTITDVMKPDEEMNMGFIFLGNLFAALAMATLYGKWARGYHGVSEGFTFGALIGMIIGLGMGFVWLGTSNFMDTTGHLVEAITDIVYYGIAGVVISLVYKATAKKDAA